MPLIGVAELDRQLAELGAAVTGKALRAAVRAGGTVVKKAAQARIPKGSRAHKTHKGRLVAPGFSSRSVRVATRVDKTGQKASAAIGVRGEAFYAAQFVELGVPSRGIAARPWLRPAMAQTLAQQEDAVAKALRLTIERAAKSRGRAR